MLSMFWWISLDPIFLVGDIVANDVNVEKSKLQEFLIL